MFDDLSIIKSLKLLWKVTSKEKRRRFKLLFVLMIITSFAEVVSIGAIVPFLAVLINPEKIYNYEIVFNFISSLGIVTHDNLLLLFTLLFIFAAILSGVMRVFLLWSYTKLSYGSGVDLGVKLYTSILNDEYELHVNRNSSEVINALSTKVNDVVFKVITPLLLLLSNSVIITIVVCFLFLLDSFVASLSIFGFGFVYFFIGKFNKKNLVINSGYIANESNNIIKTSQEGVGSIRDVIVNNIQNPYIKKFKHYSVNLRTAQGNNDIMIQSPKFIMESFAIVIIALISYFMTLRIDDVSNIIPILGAMALGGQRLIPLSQRMYMSWSSIKGSTIALQDVLSLINKDGCNNITNSDNNLVFDTSLTLSNVSYKHKSGSKNTLDDLNLKIKKGECVGIIGETGSGKSTLIDIIMGLLTPDYGILKVDGVAINKKNVRSWQSNIAHVPQDIFLTDDSIRSNIALGVEDVDDDLVKSVASQAELLPLIESWKEGYHTKVGERGVQISGGQRQRIGIARALYKNSDLLILDEATSALDTDTEKRIMKNINKLKSKKTIIIIAHRHSTLEFCSKIIKIKNSRIDKVGSFNDIC